jgi:ferric-dicitrate binding protein FerR (iron transport regulator)
MASSLEILFYKHYEGSLTAAEEAELMRLIRQPEHREELKSLFEKIWDKPDSEEALPGQTADSILQVILSAEKSGRQKSQKAPVRRLLVRLAAACVLILALAAVWTMVQNRSGKTTVGMTETAAKNDVAPGGDKAILTLGDGSHVVLDTAANGLTIQQGAGKIRKSGGRLVYDIAYELNQDKPLFNTITVPKGGQFQITLSDGSRVWLNAASSLRYPAVFQGSERQVELTGEAYFEVAKNSRAPFRVKAGSMQIGVLGTEFNVMAYSDEGQVRTTLINGSVRILVGHDSLMLQPAQQVCLYNNGTFKKIDSASVEEAIAWKQGDILFKNAGIEVIMRSLARWYDVDVEYKGKPADRFNVDIPRNVPLSEVLKILQLTNGVHFQIEGRSVIVNS